jgi:hypothetical protein
MKLFRNNSIGAEGAAKLGEGVSKLVNLTNLNLDFRQKFQFIYGIFII